MLTALSPLIASLLAPGNVSGGRRAVVREGHSLGKPRWRNQVADALSQMDEGSLHAWQLFERWQEPFCDPRGIPVVRSMFEQT